jgi:hypothetical protein
LQYQWLRNNIAVAGATDSIYYAAIAGNYTVVISSNSCTDTAVMDSVIVLPKPVPVVAFNGTELSTGTFATYQWYRDNVLIPGATSATYHPLQNGNYTVEVTNVNGCKARAAVFNVTGLGLSSVSNDWQQLMIYPNPNNGRFTVWGTLKDQKGKKIDITVIDINGKVHYHKEAKPASKADILVPLNLQPLAAGVYVVKITAGDTDSYLPFTVR